MRFYDRRDAGRRLAGALSAYRKERGTLVLGLARGGVVVADEVAKALELPLNVIVPRKIAAPGNSELAIGAITEQGPGFFNGELIQWLNVPQSYIDTTVKRERELLRKRLALYRTVKAAPTLQGMRVILVDDGMATGATIFAAIQEVRHLGAKKVVVAVPVAATETLARVRMLADDTICLYDCMDFGAVGAFYEQFGQIEDRDVTELLQLSGLPNSSSYNNRVSIRLDEITLQGELVLPRGARGVVLFAHGSGSSRFSPRNQYVAKVLQEHDLGTLLIDLLTPEEEKIDEYTRELRFNIPLLAERVEGVTDWLVEDRHTKGLPIGYFGASTGAAAALIAGARRQEAVQAIVARGGRVDLAKSFLAKVHAATLFIVGQRDDYVLELNEEAFSQLLCPKKLEVIPEATHLFEEPGTLEAVAHLASQWFLTHLRVLARV